MSTEPDPTAQPDTTPELVCSAKDCREPAVWVLRWNNPKIHTPQRRKHWLACAEHREYLATFLDRRSFLRDIIPVTDLPEES